MPGFETLLKMLSALSLILVAACADNTRDRSECVPWSSITIAPADNLDGLTTETVRSILTHNRVGTELGCWDEQGRRI